MVLFILSFPEIQETPCFLHITKACCAFHNRYVGELEKGVVKKKHEAVLKHALSAQVL